jgi:hypothetical protein
VLRPRTSVNRGSSSVSRIHVRASVSMINVGDGLCNRTSRAAPGSLRWLYLTTTRYSCSLLSRRPGRIDRTPTNRVRKLDELPYRTATYARRLRDCSQALAPRSGRAVRDTVCKYECRTSHVHVRKYEYNTSHVLLPAYSSKLWIGERARGDGVPSMAPWRVGTARYASGTSPAAPARAPLTR